MALVPLCSAWLMAYSATTVLPADVWAATKTDSDRSMRRTDCCWKGSRGNG